MASKVWFITGTSKGFGRVWAEAALERGDKVAATARDVSTLDDLVARYGDVVLPIALDVTDHDADYAAVAEAHDHFGQLDVVVNNAGYGLFGTIEEVSDEQARAQIETNLFGALWITKAALPYMREQRSGHIIQVSSIGGVQRVPDARHVPRLEVGAGGVQPVAGGGGRGLRDQGDDHRAGRLQHRLGRPVVRAGGADARLRGGLGRAHEGVCRAVGQRGTPEATGARSCELVDAENPPLRVFFGSGGLGMTRAEYESRIALWEEWDALAQRAQG